MGRRVAVALMLAAAVALPLIAGGYWLYLLSLICAYGLAALGLNLLMGSAGSISLGHGGFMALGAYGTTVLVSVAHLPYALAFVLAILGCGLVGIVVGLPAIRLKGLYLAIATLGFGVCIQRLIFDARGITAGAAGLAVPAPSFFGFSFDNEVRLYYLALVFAVIASLAISNILRHRVGRMILALRDDEIAAISFGVNSTRIKLVVFSLSAMLAGVGGALYAALLGFISPEHFTVWLSVSLIAMVVIGGLGSITGSFFGAAFVMLVPEMLRGIGQYQQIVYGLAMVGVFMAWPTGLMGAVVAIGGRLAGVRPAKPPNAGEIARITSGASGADLRRPGGNNAMTGLAVSRLSMHFGGLKAVSNASLAVLPATIVGLIGPNGSGKSTIINLVSRLYEPSGGNMAFDGDDLLARDRAEVVGLGIARTFQNVRLFRTLSVRDNLLLGRTNRTSSGFLGAALNLRAARNEERQSAAQVAELAELIGLAPDLETVAGHLPFGKQKLVEFGRALAAEPRLLLLDEPVAGMTDAEKELLVEILSRIQQLRQISILLVEHDVAFVTAICRHIYVLDFGSVIAEGTPDEIQENPRVVEAYLGAAA